MPDLFTAHLPPIEWDGLTGRARDGRPVEIIISIVTTRYVALIHTHDGQVTRRSCKSVEQAKRAAEAAITETSK